MSCHKPAKTYPEQLEILKGRGLSVTDETRALHCLAHHNYYRLSAYRFPFTVAGNPDPFLPGTTFDDLWALYHFDRTLRSLVSEAVKRLEISVRARWACALGHAHGSQAYEYAPVFRNPHRHTDALARLDEELNRSDEVFVQHYRGRFTVTVQLPRSSPAAILPTLHPPEDRRLYNTLVLLLHVVAVIEPAAHWPKRLLEHLLTLPSDLLPHMGFPSDWQQRPLWQQLLATK